MSRKSKIKAQVEAVPRRRATTRRKVWSGLVLLAVVIGATVFWRAGREAPPVVSVNTNGFDPIIAEAVKRARDAAQRDPWSGELRGRLGMVLLAHEVRAEARECFLQAIEMNPREPRWPYFLGITEMTDNPSGAVERLEQAVRLFPRSATAPRLRLANALSSLGRLDEAEALFRWTLEQEPASPRAALGLAKMLMARDQPKEAIIFLEQAIDNSSTRKAAHRLLLTAKQRLGLMDDVKRLAGALKQLPNDAAPPDPFFAEVERLKTGEEAWVNLADELINDGKPREAARLLERTLEGFPRSDRAMFFLGRARMRAGDLVGAEAVLQQAVEIDPKSIEARMQLGVVQLRRGRAGLAQESFRAVIAIKPNLSEAWFNLGLSLGKASERADCVAAFREAIRLRPDRIEAYLGLAVALRANGQDQAALAELDRALSLAPPEPLRSRLIEQVEKIRSGG